MSYLRTFAPQLGVVRGTCEKGQVSEGSLGHKIDGWNEVFRSLASVF